MDYFQRTIVLFLSLAFVIAITPAFSVVEWDEKYFLPYYPSLCWERINKVDGCQHEIYASYVENKINLSPKCCELIQGLPHRCKFWIFLPGSFTPEFGNQVKGFCATLGITPPPSYRIYSPTNNPSGQIGD
ncbi:hypothetical protein DITRI_Ditri04bG0094600 [Diplodiscus trichospermus]